MVSFVILLNQLCTRLEIKIMVLELEMFFLLEESASQPNLVYVAVTTDDTLEQRNHPNFVSAS